MTLRGELIADPDALAALLYLAPHQPGLLELLQPVGEETIRHSGDGFLQLGEVKGAVGERVEDRARPAASDQLHRAVKVRTDLFGLGRQARPAGATFRAHLDSEVTDRKCGPREPTALSARAGTGAHGAHRIGQRARDDSVRDRIATRLPLGGRR